LIYHTNIQYANQTLNWVIGDEYNAYLRNIKINYNALDDAGWIDEQIEYKFNNYGFRDNTFPYNIDFLAVGCSHTFGVGLKKEQVWVSKLGELLNKKVYNAGISGASMDTMYRLIDDITRNHDISNIFMFAPASYRYELCVDDEKDIFEVYNVHDNNNNTKPYFICTKNSWFNFNKNLKAIKYICAEQNINLIHFEVDHDFIVDNKVRDLMHSGPLAHEEFAKMFYNKFNRSSK